VEASYATKVIRGKEANRDGLDYLKIQCPAKIFEVCVKGFEEMVRTSNNTLANV